MPIAIRHEMVLRCRRQLAQLIAGGLPAGNLVEQEQALENLVVGQGGCARGRGLAAAGGRFADAFVARHGRGGRRVRRDPAAQVVGIARRVAELPEVAVNDAQQVAV